jgi:hypothetical protein
VGVRKLEQRQNARSKGKHAVREKTLQHSTKRGRLQRNEKHKSEAVDAARSDAPTFKYVFERGGRGSGGDQTHAHEW